MTAERAERSDALPHAVGPRDHLSGSGGPDHAARPYSRTDPLYGEIRVSGWAAALLATPPFQRLAGVSLSDVPGDMLFGRAFPSRLDHALGVYHLARLARPRDRALQAAALAHDLGHGPFSHLTEPFMREWLGEDHETRSARLLTLLCADLPPVAARQLTWLDCDDVSRLILGESADGRGALLNDRLDYDNADNIARFLSASGLGEPSYDPRALARGLRPLPPGILPATLDRARVCVLTSAAAEAVGWRHDRAVVYDFLHAGHFNIAAHAMLRKAIDLAAATHILPPHFFDLTDAQAFSVLAHSPDRGLLALVQSVRNGERAVYRCVWEAEVPAGASTIPDLLSKWRERLALEARLASEAGLPAYEVVVEALVSNAVRALPPTARATRSGSLVPGSLTFQPEPPPAPRIVHLLIAPSAPPDYVRRLRMAAERLLPPLGAVYRSDGAGTIGL